MHSTVSLRLALFYAAIFSVFGVELPFWPVWLSTRGLSATEISMLLALGQWIKVVTNPLAGIAADRSGKPRRVMIALSLGAIAGFALCLHARDFPSLLLVGTFVGICLSALIPLGDNVAMAAAEFGRLNYGRVRLWGSLGFILATLATGRLLEHRDADMLLYLMIIGSTLTLATVTALPQPPTLLRAVQPSGWRSLITPRFLVFLAAATLIQGSHSVFYVFGTLHWKSLGLSDGTIAALWVEGVVAEIALFFWGAQLLRRVQPLGLLALGGTAGLLRWTLTAFIATPGLLGLVQVLHAFTFAAAHLGAMHHLARTVPPAQAATGQTLYAASVGGLGAGLIIMLAGPLYAAVDGRAYLAMAALAAAGAAATLPLMATKS
jgi:MFS transporter, PPP family, 3-phenylpropionic acid transporter